MSSYYAPLRGDVGSGGGGGGGGSGLVSLLSQSYSDYVIDPANASCGVTFGNSGMSTGVGGSSYPWLLSGSASDYDIKMDPDGVPGSWLNLGTARSYTVSRTTIGENSSTVDFSIRRASDGLVLETATCTFTATVDF